MTTFIEYPPNFTNKKRTAQMWSSDPFDWQQRNTTLLENFITTPAEFSVDATSPFRIFEDIAGNYHIVGRLTVETIIAVDAIAVVTTLTAAQFSDVLNTYSRFQNAIGFNNATSELIPELGLTWDNTTAIVSLSNKSALPIPINSIIEIDLMLYRKST